MRAWLQHHGLSLAQTLVRLARSPFATTLNVLAIGVAAALPFGVYCVLGNFESLSRNASVDPQLSVFLARDAAKADIAAVEARLKGAGGVSAVRFVSRDTKRTALRSEEHTSELQSLAYLVCRLLLEKKKNSSGYRSVSGAGRHMYSHAIQLS